MVAIYETVHPRLKSGSSPRELERSYTPKKAGVHCNACLMKSLIELCKTIQFTTNKSEEFNSLSNWA